MNAAFVKKEISIHADVQSITEIPLAFTYIARMLKVKDTPFIRKENFS